MYGIYGVCGMSEEIQKQIDDIGKRINYLEVERETLKENEFQKRKKQGWFSLLNAEYESASYRTPQYLQFHRIFKKQFSELLRVNFDIVEIDISKPNHFDANGFVKLSNGNVYNFFIGDLRWSKTFTIRKAKDFKDYTGECNNDLNTEDFETFMTGLKRVVK